MSVLFLFLAKVIHILPFILLFILIKLNILTDCASVGFVIRSLLKLNLTNRDRFLATMTMDLRDTGCWNENYLHHKALFFHRSSHNFLKTSLPRGSYQTTQEVFQPDFRCFHAFFLSISLSCAFAYLSLSVIGFLSNCYLSWYLTPRLSRKWNPENRMSVFGITLPCFVKDWDRFPRNKKLLIVLYNLKDIFIIVQTFFNWMKTLLSILS